MVSRDLDYANPKLHYSFDLSKNRLFTRNDHNYINALGRKQLKTLGNTSLLDQFLSRGHTVEPHYHPNAAEVIYCVSGEITASLINPVTNENKSITIKPQQVINIPQGWWHYYTAIVNQTHVLSNFDTPSLDTVWGSDVLRLTPPRVFAHTYCLDEDDIEKAFAPLHETIIIGPPNDCQKRPEQQPREYDQQARWANQQTYPQPYPQYPYYPNGQGPGYPYQ